MIVGGGGGGGGGEGGGAGCGVGWGGGGAEKATCAAKIVLDELGRLKTGVPENELERAKGLAKGRLLLRMEDTRAVAAWSGSQELLRDQVLTVDQVVEKVDAVTRQDVARVANDFLVQGKLNLAVVGPFRSDRQFQSLLGV